MVEEAGEVLEEEFFGYAKGGQIAMEDVKDDTFANKVPGGRRGGSSKRRKSLCAGRRNCYQHLIEKTKPYLEDRFEFVVYPFADSTVCFNGEIIPKGVSKGRGMKLL